MNTSLLSFVLSAFFLSLPLAVLTTLPLIYLKNRLEVVANRTQLLFCFLNASVIVAFCRLYAKLLSAPFEMTARQDALLPPSAFVCFGLCVLHGIIFFKTLTVKLPVLLAEPALSRVWRYVLPVPLLLSVLFLWVAPREAAVVMTGRVRITTLLFLTIVPPVLWFFYHAAWWITKRLTENARIREENDLLQLEGKRYRELREYLDETRTLRHDFRQHLNVISGMAQSGQTEALVSYISQYAQSVSEPHSLFCRNTSVDAIAAHYHTIAKAQDSVIAWHLDLPETLPLLETDYCSILGNLVENALRAVHKLPQEMRSIQVTSKMLSEGMLGLSVRNPFDGNVRFGHDGLPLPSREGHGIGLQSVRNTAHKYRGSVDVQTQDGQFSVMVICMTAPREEKAHEDSVV